MKKKDYTKSHLHRGELYHDEFLNNVYRSTIWELEQEVLNKILKIYFNDELINNYLDFACGTGRIIKHFESSTINSVGIDVSESMLNVAKKNCSKSKLLIGDLTHNDVLNNEQFDLITAFRFFPNAEESLRKQVADVLSTHIKKNGYLVFNNHKNSTSLYYRTKQIFKASNMKLGMSENEIMTFLKDTDLKVIKKFHIGLLPATDSKPMFGRKYLKKIEKIFMKLPSRIICNMSQDVIYVCIKT
tara:strand:+ start:519 stop:1250 length:732 start_codon:yes stop_codon:yes gene_type:complete